MTYPRIHLRVEARSRLLGILLVLSAVVLWSSVPIGTKFLMRDSAFSPAFLSAARLWLAAGIFVAISAYYARRGTGPFHVPVRQRGWLIIAAGALCANYILYAIGLRFTTASATSVVTQVNCVATVLLSAWLLGERLTPGKVLGMVTAVTGVLLVVFHGTSLHDLLASRFFLGNVIEVVGALTWPFYAIGQTKLLEGGNSRQTLMPVFVVAALISALLLPLTGPLFHHAPLLQDWLVLLFLGVGSTAAAYWLFAAGIQRMETSEGAMFTVLMPPLALIMAAGLLGEHVRGNVLTGLALVVCGLVLIVWRRGHSYARKPQRAEHRPLPVRAPVVEAAASLSER